MPYSVLFLHQLIDKCPSPWPEDVTNAAATFFFSVEKEFCKKVYRAAAQLFTLQKSQAGSRIEDCGDRVARTWNLQTPAWLQYNLAFWDHKKNKPKHRIKNGASKCKQAFSLVAQIWL